MSAPDTRLPTLLRAGGVTLQAFEPRFTDVVLRVRNHESIRLGMRDTTPIAAESHLRWVQKNLVDERKVHLFVVFDDSEPVGIALLRDFRDGAAEVGLMVIEAARRPIACYAGAVMIVTYAMEMLGLDRLFSLVPRHNDHALAFNRHFGFDHEGADDDAIYHRLVLTKARFRAHATHRRFREKHGLNGLVQPV
jgi:RimJ/RimL family protein N-acetyltransferase